MYREVQVLYEEAELRLLLTGHGYGIINATEAQVFTGLATDFEASHYSILIIKFV